MLNVDIKPSAEAYKPGEKAKVKIRLTDFTGEAFVGSTVVAIYDKSLEYISGGSNVPDIKEFFWKWRRSHYPQTENSLNRSFNTIDPAKRSRHVTTWAYSAVPWQMKWTGLLNLEWPVQVG